MTDTDTERTTDYGALGLVANPFPEDSDEAGSDPYWVRVATRAATNALLAGCVRAASPGRARPLLLTITRDIPDYYPLRALNDFLSRAAHEPELHMMAMNMPLEVMQFGTIRGPLAELAERLAASDFPRTAGEYFARMLKDPDLDLPEASAVSMEQIEQTAAEFAAEPGATAERIFGSRFEGDGIAGTMLEDDALHATYLRQMSGASDVEGDSPEGEGLDMPEYDAPPAAALGAAEAQGDEAAEPVDPQRVADEAIREYLLACLSVHLSPVIVRALRAYRSFGSTILAQEIKVTKAPRKTLAAVLEFMSARFGTIVIIFNGFDPWPRLEPEARRDVLLALAELRLIVGEVGVLGVSVEDGYVPEIEEQFAGGVRVHWSFDEAVLLQGGETAFDAAVAQRWLDAAAVSGESAARIDGPEVAPLVEAAAGDILAFARMSEAAFRSAAERGCAAIDEEAVAAGLAAGAGKD